LVKAIFDPSGDHFGSKLLPTKVIWWRPEPSASTTKICWFGASPSTNAIWEPSGDQSGSTSMPWLTIGATDPPCKTSSKRSGSTTDCCWAPPPAQEMVPARSGSPIDPTTTTPMTYRATLLARGRFVPDGGSIGGSLRATLDDTASAFLLACFG